MKKSKIKYISLQEATKYCDYSQEYLSLRARQGKLKSIKIGRNWVTTKSWLNNYLRQVNNYKNNRNKKSEPIRPRQRQAPAPARIATRNVAGGPKIRFAFLPASLREALQAGALPDFIKQNLQEAAVAIAVFVLFLAGGVFAFQQIQNNPEFVEQITDSTKELVFYGIASTQKVLFDISKEAKSTGLYLTKLSTTKTASTYFLASTIDVLKDTFGDYSKWFLKNVKRKALSIKENYLAINDFALAKTKQAKQTLAQAWIGALEGAKSDLNKFVFQLTKKEKITEKPKQVEKRKLEESVDELEKNILKDIKQEFKKHRQELDISQKQGMIVIPSTEKDEGIKKKIQDSFSDEVNVEPKDEASGIITPVFKERQGDEYLYLMVPIKE
ncbi:hypothetical protein AMJ49_04660 [Parcubacteria bacterium DG_74_2]|nr:MAG: hypothetical protein AMJ49_04660 [Parcubacteria bacterium DG_74_2]